MSPGQPGSAAAHIGEPTSPPLIHHARGPPQTELDIAHAGGETEDAAQKFFPDDLDQTPQLPPLRSGEASDVECLVEFEEGGVMLLDLEDLYGAADGAPGLNGAPEAR